MWCHLLLSLFTYDGLVEFDNIFGTTEIGRVQYLKDSLERIGDKKKLLIIDESHMRSGKDASLDLFLKKAGIYINGDQIRDDVYILTVSATPNAPIERSVQKRTWLCSCHLTATTVFFK